MSAIRRSLSTVDRSTVLGRVEVNNYSQPSITNKDVYGKISLKNIFYEAMS